MTAKARIEHDSMGALEVPADALWGAQTQRAIQNFPPSGLKMPPAFIRALGLIKHAAAGANSELGDLAQSMALAPTLAASSIPIPRPASRSPPRRKGCCRSASMRSCSTGA